MKIWVGPKRNKFIISFSISGIIILIGVFSLFYMLTPSLSIDDAEKRVLSSSTHPDTFHRIVYALGELFDSARLPHAESRR